MTPPKDAAEQSFEEYWRKQRPHTWTAKSEELKHLHTWLCGMQSGTRIGHTAALGSERKRYEEIINAHIEGLDTLEDIAIGSFCSACSCNCHNVANETAVRIRNALAALGEKGAGHK